MKVDLSDRARECIAQLQKSAGLPTARHVVEAALWGIEGPARELSDREWDRALGRDRPDLFPLGPSTGRGIPAEEALKRVRALIADHKRRTEDDSAVFLGELASNHVQLFVRAGIYPTAEAAVEAALVAAVTSRAPLPAIYQETW